MKKTFILMLGVVATTAGAQIVNGGFEDGLNGWNIDAGAADVTVFSREFENSRDFIPPTREDWKPVSGERFGSLWSTDSNGINRSQISQRFNAESGQWITFNWFFDFGDVAQFPDTARGWLEDENGSVVTTFFSINPTIDDVEFEENWTLGNPVRYDFQSTGIYTIRFETIDGPGVFESILGVDNVTVVPEPATMSALLIGLAVIARRRRK